MCFPKGGDGSLGCNNWKAFDKLIKTEGQKKKEKRKKKKKQSKSSQTTTNKLKSKAPTLTLPERSYCAFEDSPIFPAPTRSLPCPMLFKC